MEKNLLKQIRIAANTLPVFQYQVMEPQKISGAEALLAGWKEVDGQPIDPEKEYVFKAPAFYPVNHYRRMKKIYNENVGKLGQDGAFKLVTHYINSCFAAAKQRLQ